MMNFKSLIAAGTVAAASLAFATDTITSPETLCRIAVTNDASEIILSVPLIDVGGSAQSINITNMVLTTNLSENDMLMYKNGSTWYTWILQGSKWVPTQTTVNGTTSVAANNAVFNRGDGVWLVRSDTTKPVFLFGQCGTGTVKSKSFTAGTSTDPAYTLMASPKEEDFDPNTANWSGCKQGDMIVFPNEAGIQVPVTYLSDTALTGWCEQKKNTTTGRYEWVKTPTKIPAGQGFWYVSRGGSGSVSW